MPAPSETNAPKAMRFACWVTYWRQRASWRKLRRRDLAVAGSRAGGVLVAEGKLAEAQAAFAEYLKISRRLAELDPDNAGWQRDLAVAWNRTGGVLEAQGKLAEAQAAFDEYLK